MKIINVFIVSHGIILYMFSTVLYTWGVRGWYGRVCGQNEFEHLLLSVELGKLSQDHDAHQGHDEGHAGGGGGRVDHQHRADPALLSHLRWP